MPIIAALIAAIAGSAYAGYWIFNLVASRLGSAMGYGAVVLVAALIVFLIAFGVRRYYRLHGKTVNKERVLRESLSNNNGSIQLEPNHKSGVIQLSQQPELRFIFADIKQVQLNSTKEVTLQLRDSKNPINLAFNKETTAKLWVKRLLLAAEQKL